MRLIPSASCTGRIHWSDSGCHAADCAGIAVLLIASAFHVVAVALLFALAGALFPHGPNRTPILATLWLFSSLCLLTSIASGYRAGYGATWLWHEPFVELLFHPIVTPSLLVAGLIAHLWWLRPEAEMDPA